MPGCIDSFHPSLQGWFYLESQLASPTLELSVNGQALFRFKPDLPRQDVSQEFGLSEQIRTGFNISTTNILQTYLDRANSLGIECKLEVRSISHPKEPIHNRALAIKPSRESTSPACTPNNRLTANIYTINFFDPAGNSVYTGGAERYIIDLAALLDKHFGLKTVVYQRSHYNWIREYQTIPVIGLACPGGDYKSISASFQKTNPGCINIYSPLALASSSCHPCSIGISHGAYWDDPNRSQETTQSLLDDVWTAAKNIDTIISVDANTLTTLQALSDFQTTKIIQQAYAKTKIILNYASSDFRRPARKWQDYSQEHPCNVLYARRLYRPRGFELTLKALPETFKACPHLQFSFVGGADPEERRKLKAFLKEFPRQTSHQELLPDDMPDIYAKNQISLIPTLHSEGTSLSCLESMASGCVVISSHAGGLANIVINNFNGIIVTPTPKALSQSIIDCYHNPGHCRNLSENGQRVALALNHQSWEQQWEQAIRSLLDHKKEHSYPLQQGTQGTTTARKHAVRIFHHPFVGGISQEESDRALPSQRPQAIFDLLKKLGYPTSFCSSTTLFNTTGPAKTPEYTCYDENAIIYIYKPLLYAFVHSEARDFLLAKYRSDAAAIGRYCYDQLEGDEDPWQLLQENAEKIRSKDPITWFDWIDSPWIDILGKIIPENHKAIIADYIQDVYRLTVANATIFTTTSPTLQHQAKRLYNREPVLLGNATHSRYAFIGEENQPAPRLSSELLEATRRFPHKLIYWGAISPDILDLELIRYLAAMTPSVAFLLAGPGGEHLEEAAENIITIGQIPQSQLWRLAPYCQAAFIPFQVNEATHVVNPLKLHEYIELGLPVIASNTKDINSLYKAGASTQDIYCCETPADWLQALNSILARKAKDSTSYLPVATLWADMANPLLRAIREQAGEPMHPHVRFNREAIRIIVETPSVSQPLASSIVGSITGASDRKPAWLSIGLRPGIRDLASGAARLRIRIPCYLTLAERTMIFSCWLNSQELSIASVGLSFPEHTGLTISQPEQNLGCFSLRLEVPEPMTWPLAGYAEISLRAVRWQQPQAPDTVTQETWLQLSMRPLGPTENPK